MARVIDKTLSDSYYFQGSIGCQRFEVSPIDPLSCIIFACPPSIWLLKRGFSIQDAASSRQDSASSCFFKVKWMLS
jgi:hypothetical protein